MPKINVYLPDELAAAVRDAKVPVSAICQKALEEAVRTVGSARATDAPATAPGGGSPTALFGRFTPRAKQAITLAEQAAREFPHNYVGTEHVLLGLIDEGGNLGIKVLQSLEVELTDLRAELVASMGPASTAVEGHIPFTKLAKQALEATAKEAFSMMHNYIGSEHLLLGLLATEDGLASQVLRRMGVELRTTRRTTITALSGFVHAKETLTPAQPDASAALEDILTRLAALEEKLAG